MSTPQATIACPHTLTKPSSGNADHLISAILRGITGKPESADSLLIYARLDLADGTTKGSMLLTTAGGAATVSAHADFPTGSGWKQYGDTDSAVPGLVDFLIRVASSATAGAYTLSIGWHEGAVIHKDKTSFVVAADAGAIATDVAAILVDTADMQPKLGTPAGASVSADIAAVLALVEFVTNTTTVDDATLDGGFAHTTTVIQSSELEGTNDVYTGQRVILRQAGTGAGHIRTILSYDAPNKRITVSVAFAVTPVNGDTIVVIPA